MSIFEDKDVLGVFEALVEEGDESPSEKPSPQDDPQPSEKQPDDSESVSEASPEVSEEAEVDAGESEEPFEEANGLAEAYKDLYAEELPEQAKPYEEYLTQVSDYEGKLLQRSQELYDEQNKFKQTLKQYDAKYTFHNGKGIGEMSDQELLAFSQHLYDTEGAEGQAVLSHALQQERLQKDIVSKVEEFNGFLDRYEWDASFSELVKKRPELYDQLPKIQKGLEEVLKKVDYQPNDKSFKDKLIKSVLRNMAHSVKPPQKPKQTPEAEVVKQSPKTSAPKKTTPTTDELAQQMLDGEFNPFELLP